jgi:hypothetical protein
MSIRPGVSFHKRNGTHAWNEPVELLVTVLAILDSDLQPSRDALLTKCAQWPS